MIHKYLTTIFCFVLGAIPAFAQDNFGYVPNKKATSDFVSGLPSIYGQQVADLVAGDANEDALLYRALVPSLERSGQMQWIVQRGEWKVVRSYNQGNVGSCVGNATAACLSVLNAVECVIKNESQEFTAMHSADGCYGLCREAADMLGMKGDGCYGSAAARAMKNLGTLYCIEYANADLRINDPNRAKQYGYNGVGASLKKDASDRKIVSATLVKTAKEAWSLIGNGYPINVCSGQGFSTTRDAEGICKPKGTWYHSMAVIARRTTADGRKLFLVWNSWGDNWCNGPYWQDMPEGSFFVEWSIMDKMLAVGDSFAYSGLEGFPKRTLADLGTKEYLGQLKVEGDDMQKIIAASGAIGLVVLGGQAVETKVDQPQHKINESAVSPAPEFSEPGFLVNPMVMEQSELLYHAVKIQNRNN